jgi:two-component system, OmpR family, phosphate regulon sensor histidine kinase PhoR
MEIAVILLLGALAAVGFMLFRERQTRRDLEATHARELAAQRERRDVELRSQAGRTAALFDRMVEGIVVLGSDGRIRLSNRAAAAFFGFKPPAEGQTVLEATRHHEVAAIVGRLAREPEVLNHELRLDGAGGARFLQVNALALRSVEGANDGAILVFHDLTRLRQLEALRQEFVANVSHELRTPLSLIKSAAETLIDGGRDDPAITARFLEIIDKHANRLTHLIDDLLLLARIDSGRVELNLSAVDLRAAADDALDDAALIARAREVSLLNEVPDSLRAEADPERLRQVLANLIDNAIKYGKQGGVVTLRGREAGGGMVEISVRDVAGVRAFLPRRQGAFPRAGRHGTGARDREERGAGPRRRCACRKRGRSRRGVLSDAPRRALNAGHRNGRGVGIAPLF